MELTNLIVWAAPALILCDDMLEKLERKAHFSSTVGLKKKRLGSKSNGENS